MKLRQNLSPMLAQNNEGHRRLDPDRPPHINIIGMPGAGKSTSAALVAALYVVIWIHRLTSRELREGEDGTEYKRETPKTILKLMKSGYLLFWGGAITPGEDMRGTIDPMYWPPYKPDTDAYVSVFSPEASLKLEEEGLAPGMISIFLTGSEEKLLSNIEKRDGPGTQEKYRKIIRRYKGMELEKKFEHVINTDDKSPVEVVRQIIDIVWGSAPPTDHP